MMAPSLLSSFEKGNPPIDPCQNSSILKLVMVIAIECEKVILVCYMNVVIDITQLLQQINFAIK
jgi:hypothetical protein